MISACNTARDRNIIVLNETGLRRVLRQYVDYFNHSRTHLGLAKDTPVSQLVSSGPGRIVVIPQVGGLHHRYDRLAA